MSIVNNAANNEKLEREINKPNNWESNIIYVKKNGTVIEQVIADDEEGGE